MNRVQLAATRKRVVKQITELKKKVAEDVASILEMRGMTQTEASYQTGEAPSQISLVATGKLRGFSLERLLRMRAMLGAEINLEVTSSTDKAVTYAFN
jgi:predicted XRE-type DNA-binding protein